MRRTTVAAPVLVAALLASVPLTLVAGPAAAAPPGTALVAGGFAGPMDLAVAVDGTVFATELGQRLTRIDPRGARSVVLEGPVAGVDARVPGAVSVTISGPPPEEGGGGSQSVARVSRGSLVPFADLGAYEAANNPDAGQTYGFAASSSAACLAQAGAVGLGSYTGIVESNPFGIAVRGATRFVADAAANAVLRVGPTGRVSTVAVLPPQPAIDFTEELRQGLLAQFNEGVPPEEQLPPDFLVACVGSTFTGEPVPTDVELAPNGDLFVSGLPGFPELPGTGSVYRIDRRGHVEVWATGFSGAVDLAVARDGTVWVAELFGGQLSEVVDGEVVSTLALPSPSAVEVTRRGVVYVAVGAFGPEASIVRLT